MGDSLSRADSFGRRLARANRNSEHDSFSFECRRCCGTLCDCRERGRTL